MYATRVMFHGPAYRGVEAVHALSQRGARGRLRVPAPPGSLLDSALQLIGNWGNVILPTRNVLFPTGFGSIQFFGPPPAPGDIVECTGRVTAIDERSVVGDFQFCVAGQTWAMIYGCESRRFDSHQRARAVELAPGRNAVALRQPEGWVATFDYWTDPATRNSFARATLGAAAHAEYEREKIATRTGWLLERLSVKDAVRYLLWEAHDRDIFPVEISVGEGEDGRPHAHGWAGLTVPACEISSARASHLGVAIARPARREAMPGAPGPGIGVAEITDNPPGAPPPLSDQELAVLERASCADQGPPGPVWHVRFRAAKEAVAKAEGIPLSEASRVVTVTGATNAVTAATARDRNYQVRHREIGAPAELRARRYAVAWTWGPEE